jgi:hypothetical protein
VIMITIASARSPAPPVKERERHSGRTSLRAFRGVPTQDGHRYEATDEAMIDATRVLSHLIPGRCLGARSSHTSYT